MATPPQKQALNLLSFSRYRSLPNDKWTRNGRLKFPDRAAIDTPHYVAVSSRGVVPHLSQDMMRDKTSTKAMYAALEDFIEKASLQDKIPPVYKFPASPHESPLRKFIALQKDVLLILGPRRIPPLPCPASGTSTAISIVTSLGFSMLEYTDYVEAIQKLRPDILVGLGDVLFGHKPGVKRADRMGDRTLAWMNELVSRMNEEEFGTSRTALFAPILPIEAEMQAYYLGALQDELKASVSGLVLYDLASIDAVPNNLRDLPRLYLGHSNSPHKVLDAIAIGVDILTIPFITEATDAGIALDFSFPPIKEPNVATPLPLGIDMWSPTFATVVLPLRKGCECYTCTNHHRAFVHHLLNAKEMLGWVLLQLHNHRIMDDFFDGIRNTLHNETFEDERTSFERIYSADMPVKTGQGPRVRGYQFKSEGKGEARKNPPAYRSLDDGKEKLAEAALPNRTANALDLEQQGFAEKAE